MITNNMSILARRALNKDSTSMIALLGYSVSRAMLAGLAGEGQLVGGLIRLRIVDRH